MYHSHPLWVLILNTCDLGKNPINLMKNKKRQTLSRSMLEVLADLKTYQSKGEIRNV